MASKVIRIKNERLKRIPLETLPPMLVAEMLRYMANGSEEFSIWFQGWTVECKKEEEDGKVTMGRKEISER